MTTTTTIIIIMIIMINTHKLLWVFEIQTDHRISARRPDLIIINKKKREFPELLSRLTTE